MALDKNEPMAKYNLWQKVSFALVSKLPFYFVASMMADETNCRKMAGAHPKKLSKFWPSWKLYHCFNYSAKQTDEDKSELYHC